MLDLPNIRIIGVTGMSGAGKSTVCREISKYCGTVIDCDKVARETASRRDFLGELKERFGGEILNPDGTLDRAETARIIFSDERKRALYNRIIFQYIVYEVIRRIKTAKGMVLVDAPTLFEAGLDMICTEIVSVTADLDICAGRISKRDGISPERARARLMSQHDADFFREHSRYNLENNGTEQELTARAEALARTINGEQ